MQELYNIILDQSVCIFLTLAIIGIVTVGWVYRLWSNSQLAHVKLTAEENIQIYIFGAIAFVDAVIMFGYVAFPDNAENMLELMGLKFPLFALTSYVQRGMLWIVRLMM